MPTCRTKSSPRNASRVHEHGGTEPSAPVAFQLHRAFDEAIATDHIAGLVAAADFLVAEAADRTVATREEAQLGWQQVEVVDLHGAHFPEQDQAHVRAERAQPLELE